MKSFARFFTLLVVLAIIASLIGGLPWGGPGGH